MNIIQVALLVLALCYCDAHKGKGYVASHYPVQLYGTSYPATSHAAPVYTSYSAPAYATTYAATSYAAPPYGVGTKGYVATSYAAPAYGVATHGYAATSYAAPTYTAPSYTAGTLYYPTHTKGYVGSPHVDCTHHHGSTYGAYANVYPAATFAATSHSTY